MAGNEHISVFRDAFGPGFLPGMARPKKSPVTRAFQPKWADPGHIDDRRDLSPVRSVTPEPSMGQQPDF